MQTGLTNLFKVWGMNTQGDFGPYTMYTSKRKHLVVFLKAPPKEPPSPAQQQLLARFKTAAGTWNQLSADDKAKWRLAVARTRCRIGANALWTFWQMTRDRATIATIERQSGITLTLEATPDG